MALWVFGYGSLLWDPGFEPVETRKAVLKDYHRSFCMLSIHYRGTEEKPGLVLALDQADGGQCTGVAFRAADEDADAVLAMLRERELISYAYYEDNVTVTDESGQDIDCVTYIINRDNDQYCHHDLETQAQLITRSTGTRGPNRDYLYNTKARLDALNIRDKDMTWLTNRVRELSQND